MGLFKDRISFDPSNPTDIDKIRSYISTESGLLTSTTVGSDESLDVASYLRDDAGTLFTGTTVGADHGLDVNVLNEITATCDLDGVYASGTNDDPDNVGIIAHIRNAAPGDSQQTLRPTGDSPDSDSVDPANVQALDMNSFLMGWTGSAWERIASSSGAIGVGGSIADDEADGGDPLKIGSRAVDSALTEVSAENDRADVISDMYRRMYVTSAPNVAMDYGAATVTTSAAVLAAANSGRQRILVQNRGAQSIYVGGDASVTASNGVEIPKFASLEIPLGENVPLYAIAASGTPDVRYMQIA